MKHWIIDVKGWGTLYAYGTEEQAEEWRRHKANWEGSIATKRIASKDEINTHNCAGNAWDILEDLL